MVTIIQSPNQVLMPAYSDIEFVVTEINPQGEPPPVVEAKIYVNGELKAVQKHKPASRDFPPTMPIPGSTDQVSVFNINIKDCISNCFENTDPLRAGSGALIQNSLPDCTIEFCIEFCTWYPDECGILINEEVPVKSNSYFAINAIRNICDDPTLANYIPGAFGGFSFLTNKPSKTCVCLEDSEWLYYFSTSEMGGMIITTYDEDGNEITGVGIVLEPSVFGVEAINVGPNNINNATNFITIDESVFCYTVEVINGGMLSEQKKYYVRHCCQTAYRVHFLNPYGKYDSFSAVCFIDDSYTIKSKEFESTASFIQTRAGGKKTGGRTKLYSEATESFNMTASKLKNGEREWLKDLSISPNVFIEIDNDLIPVILKDSKKSLFLTKSNRNDQIELEFEHSISNFSQRN